MVVNSKGFTLMELVVVVAIIGTLALIAMPNVIDWAQKASYKEAARDIGGALKLAKSEAIASGTERKLVLDLDNNEFSIEEGNRARNSTSWTLAYEGVMPDNTGLKAGTGDVDTGACNLAAGAHDIVFRSNGTVANPPDFRYACVMDAAGATEEYRTKLLSLMTGRVQVERR